MPLSCYIRDNNSHQVFKVQTRVIMKWIPEGKVAISVTVTEF